MTRARISASLVAASVVLVLSACGAQVPMPTPTSTPTPVAPSGDGILRIATVLPSASAAQVAAVEVAAREINEAGGWRGVPVEVVHRTAGEDAATAVAAVESLSGLGIDVLISGSTAEVFAAVAPVALAQGSVLISPTAQVPGGAELSFSLEPTGALAAATAAALPDEAARVVILSVDAALGSAIEAAALADGREVVLSETVADDNAALVARAAKTKPDLTVVAGGGLDGAAALVELLAGRKIDRHTVLIAGSSVLDTSVSLAPGALDEVSGVQGDVAGLTQEAITALLRSDPGLTDFGSAAEVHDAVILAALAATSAGDDGGPSIASRIPSVAAGPALCSRYAECLAAVDGGWDVGFAGWTGTVRLNDAGNRDAGAFSVYRFNSQNSPELERVIPVE